MAYLAEADLEESDKKKDPCYFTDRVCRCADVWHRGPKPSGCRLDLAQTGDQQRVGRSGPGVKEPLATQVASENGQAPTPEPTTTRHSVLVFAQSGHGLIQPSYFTVERVSFTSNFHNFAGSSSSRIFSRASLS